MTFTNNYNSLIDLITSADANSRDFLPPKIDSQRFADGELANCTFEEIMIYCLQINELLASRLRES